MIWKLAIRIGEVNAIGIKRRAQGAARVSRRGGDENPLKTGFLEDPVVGDTIRGSPRRGYA